MDAADGGWQRLQVFGLQQAIGAAFAAKVVDRTAVGADGYHRQGGRRIENGKMLGGDASVLQKLEQAMAEMITGEPAKQSDLHAQSRQPDSDVERRAARHCFEIQAIAAIDRRREYIEKCFTTDEVHGGFLRWKSPELKRDVAPFDSTPVNGRRYDLAFASVHPDFHTTVLHPAAARLIRCNWKFGAHSIDFFKKYPALV